MRFALVSNIIRFITLVLFQVLVLNHIHFGEFVIPYMYVLYILLLPYYTPKWILLLMAFILGSSIDVFTHTPGLHTLATVFMAYLRPPILSVFALRDGYDANTTLPSVYFMGLKWFLKYALVLVFLHHFVLFYTEIFRFSEFFYTLLRVSLSTLLTMCFIIISQYFIFQK